MRGRARIVALAVRAVLALALFWALPVRAAVLSPELAQSLARSGERSEIPVIVSLAESSHGNRLRRSLRRQVRARSAPRARHRVARALRLHAERRARPLRRLLGRRRARRVKSLWLTDRLALTAHPSLIRELAGRPDVLSLGLDATLALPPEASGPAFDAPWNLDQIRVPALWNLGFRGTGVVIASLDTGVDASHPDLAGRWRGGSNSWYDPSGEHPFIPADADGHGTRVMGVLVAGSSGGTSIGVAPDAEWIAVKIFDDAGSTHYSDIHLGFQWLFDPDGDPKTDDFPDVVNLSWALANAPGQCVSEFERDLQALEDAGIVVVSAAGNGGPGAGTSLSPANYGVGLSVGSLDDRSNVAPSSSRGPSACTGRIFPSVTAPGQNILTSESSGIGLPVYANVSGTSFAAPHVAGMLALLREAFPAAGVRDLAHAVRFSALDLGPANADDDYGDGIVDALGAYDWLAARSGCPAPAAGADADGDGVADVCDNCSASPNPGQVDSNDDGFGNVCDADLDGDATVGLADLGRFMTGYREQDPDLDLNEDGWVNVLDIGRLFGLYAGGVGPSGLRP